MLHLETIQSLDAPELELYRTLRRSEEHERAGVFVATNAKVVQRLLAAQYPLLSMLLTPAWLEKLGPQLRARPDDLRVFIAEKKIVEAISGYQVHQGAFAAAKIPPAPSFEELFAASPRPLLLAAVESISSAENLGAVIRNCVAFGVHFLIVGETCCSPWLRRSVSSSMGAIFAQPLVRTDNLVRTLNELRGRGVRCLAAHPQPGSKKLSAMDLRGDGCVVFGAEGPGLSGAVLAACDDAVEIPMPPGVDSLNVASATAVFLYEARRQRG
ncbi:MAG: RNA methyltransferase [Verrucomicrobia bacterium]|nr:RNA methyltransferase [Verrucomicrobiota bacterium]